MVFDFIFYCVTVKTLYIVRKYDLYLLYDWLVHEMSFIGELINANSQHAKRLNSRKSIILPSSHSFLYLNINSQKLFFKKLDNDFMKTPKQD